MMMRGEKARDFKGTMRKLIAYLSPHKVADHDRVGLRHRLDDVLDCRPENPRSGDDQAVRGRDGADLPGPATASTSATSATSSDSGRACTCSRRCSATSRAGSWRASSMQITYRCARTSPRRSTGCRLRYFDGTNHGEVLSRITNDVDTVSQTLNQSLTQIVTSVTTVVGVLIMMLSISWMMTLATALIIPLSLVVIALVGQQVAEILPRAAGLPRPRQRARRGDVRRARRDEGLQRRSEEHREVRQPTTTRSTARPGSRSSSPA